MNRHFNELSKNKHHSIYLQRSYDKHGVDSFIPYVLFKSESSELIKDMELFLINKFYNHTYNVSKQSGGGDLLTYHPNKEKIRSKIVEGVKAYYKTKEGKERKELLSANMSGEQNPMYGNTHTEEAREKISSAIKGRKATVEQREVCSLRMRKRYESEDEREKLSQRMLKYYENPVNRVKTGIKSKESWVKNREKHKEGCRKSAEANKSLIIYNGKEYSFVKDIAEEFNLSIATISKQLHDNKFKDAYYVERRKGNRVRTDAEKKRMSEERKGRKHSKETLAKMRGRGNKPHVLRYSEGEFIQFDSLKTLNWYLKEKHGINGGTSRNIKTSLNGWEPKKHKHRYLKGLKIENIINA